MERVAFIWTRSQDLEHENDPVCEGAGKVSSKGNESECRGLDYEHARILKRTVYIWRMGIDLCISSSFLCVIAE